MTRRACSMPRLYSFLYNATATTEIYTLSLHDALPIYTGAVKSQRASSLTNEEGEQNHGSQTNSRRLRSEEHTSELQSPDHLVCRLLLEKKKSKNTEEQDRKITSHNITMSEKRLHRSTR